MDLNEDSILWLKPSQQMLEFIKSEVGKNSDSNIPKQIEEVAADKSSEISADDLEWVYERAKKQGLSISEMGVEMLLPVPKIAPRNPQLEARCQRLQREQEDREYRAMTKMVDPRRHREPEESIASQLQQINRQLIGVVQFVFSVAAGFAFGFVGLELMFGNLDMGFRLMCGISCALVIAVAEIYFLLRHISFADNPPEEYPSPKKVPATDSAASKIHQD